MLRHYDRNWSAIIDKVAYKDSRLEALDLIKDQGGDKSPKYDVTKDRTLVAFVPTFSVCQARRPQALVDNPVSSVYLHVHAKT